MTAFELFSWYGYCDYRKVGKCIHAGVDGARRTQLVASQSSLERRVDSFSLISESSS